MIALDFYIMGIELSYLFWRKPLYLAFIAVIALPFQNLNTQLSSYYNAKKYEMTFYTGQVAHLEYVLNQEFDPIDRLIYYRDVIGPDDLYLYNASEMNEKTFVYNKAEAAAPLYLFNSVEADLYPSFEIVVPIGLSYSLVAMKALIDKYKVAGKTYQIIEL